MMLKSYFLQLNVLQRICLFIIISYLFFALAADFIANDKPFYCNCSGKSVFPIFKSYLEKVGVSGHSEAFDYKNCTSRLMPLIPFHSNTLDPSSNGYTAPLHKSSTGIHILGTDALGKDVLAGLIYGTRYALTIGILSTLFSFIPGVFIGMMMGYWQNHRLRLNYIQVVASMVAIFLFVFEMITISYVFKGFEFLLIVLSLSFVLFLIHYCILNFFKFNIKTMALPLDNMLMRFIEIFESFPKLLLLMTLTILIARSSVLTLILLIAVIRWPIFAQISRAETLRVRNLNFTLSAENIGLPWSKILTRHIWPNIKGTLLVTALFSFNASILLEASLSFIGLGLKLEQVSWGSLLNEGRHYFPGWWLSLFPGLTIFVLIISLNWLFDDKKKAMV